MNAIANLTLTAAMFLAYCQAGTDVWMPAHQGTETPIRTRSGRRLLYCFNPAVQNSGKEGHAYYDMDRDVILTDEEALSLISI